jgi:hypothetical protein
LCRALRDLIDCVIVHPRAAGEPEIEIKGRLDDDDIILRRGNLRTNQGDIGDEALARRTEIELALRRLAPRIPSHEFEAAVDHAVTSKGLSHASAERATWLSLVAYVRHALTEYDDLLTQGYDQESARFFVATEISTILNSWGVQRQLTALD